MSSITARDVHFSRGARPVLRGIDLRHRAGEVLTLLGPSGSGKTTLLWLMAGLLRPDRGGISYDAGGAGGGTGAPPPPPRMGFVFQGGGVWEHLTARGHLELVLSGHGLSRRERAERVARALDEVGLGSHAARRPGELSGGERQRLALARAVVVEPQWLLLDEPTSHLDGPAREALVELLERRLRERRGGVLMATHQVDLALRLSDRLAILLDGRIAQDGPPAQVYEVPVSLAVARLLGPAFELHGEMRGDALIDGDRIVLRSPPGANDSRITPEMTSLILRPQQVQFVAEPGGAWTPVACRFVGGSWEVELRGPRGAAAWATVTAPIEEGTRGSLRLRARQPAPRVTDVAPA